MSSISEKIALLGAFSACLAILAIVDHRRNLLPDSVTLPLAGSGLLVNMHGALADFSTALTGLAAGYAAIRLLHDLQLAAGRSPGIGLGDAKLLAALGAWLGWPALPFLVMGGAMVMLVFYPVRREKPFGTGLAVTAVVILLAGDELPI